VRYLTGDTHPDHDTICKANASKHKSVRYDRAGDLEQKLRQDIEELLGQAEKTDSEGAADEQKLPREIARREALLEKMRWSRRDSYEQVHNAQAAVDTDRAGELDGGPLRCHHFRGHLAAEIRLPSAEKVALGLRQFLLRGLEKVRIEWDLTCLAYNMRRMWRLAEA
jgi:hypothetical protein